MKLLPGNAKQQSAAKVAILILVAVISFCILGPLASDPVRHEKTIASIDEKIDTVLELTEISTLASAGISALPGDMATPIADRLAEFAQDFLLILCVLFSEKYLITVMGMVCFWGLIPLGCLLGVASLVTNPYQLRRLAAKTIVLGIALYLAIPASIFVSDKVYETYETSINETLSSAKELALESEELDFELETSGITGLVAELEQTVKNLINRASYLVHRYVEVIAIMVVTACVIPLLGLLLFLWVAHSLTGIDVFSHLIPRFAGTKHFRFRGSFGTTKSGS